MSTPILMPFQDQPFNGDVFVCEEFLALKKQYNLNAAVETGSCLYSTTLWLSENFEKVFTVEINPEYAKHGVAKVTGKDNVKAVIGADSVDFIKTELTPDLTEEDRVIFFLDAHWGNNCPLLDELGAISLLKLNQPPLIVIHDFCNPSDNSLGYDSYNGQPFVYEWIQDSVEMLAQSFRTNYKHFYNTEATGARRGVVYIYPEK